MAQITLTTNDANVPRIVAALRQDFTQNQGETNAAFVRRCINRILIERVKQYEAAQASRTAYDTTASNVENENIFT